MNDHEQLMSEFDFTEEDRLNIKNTGELLKDYLPEFIHQFYEWLGKQEAFTIFFHENPLLLERVQSMQAKHWSQFFHADINAAYIASRRHVGAVHARINLSNTIYCAGMAISGALLCNKLDTISPAPSNLNQLKTAVTKLIAIDTHLALDEIHVIQKNTLANYTDSIMSMSTPVTPIWEGILLLPLLGIVDSNRAQDIMHKTLTKISETTAKVFIMDISGIAAVDTAVANQLLKITKATQLMGCKAIISGISPEVAYTLVELGVLVGEIKTTSTLMDALKSALKYIEDNTAPIN